MRLSAEHSRQARVLSWLSVSFSFCLILAACGLLIGGVNSAPPPGWTDITPPDTRQVAQYAVSPDVPGLILATIGGYSQASAEPPPPAQLWRSTDGGATWRTEDSLSILAGAEIILPPGGHGLAFAYDPLGLGNPISVSADAGASWRALSTTSARGDTDAEEWKWLSGAVAIGSRLYAGGVAPGWGGLESGAKGFSVSDDHGFTWRPLETKPDPASSGMMTQAIAPLDANGSAWLRLTAQGGYLSSMGADLPPRIAIERSIDGGVTWTALSQHPHIAGMLIGAQLSTSPAHPGHICASLIATVLSTSSGGASKGGAARAAAGPPPPLPMDISLIASGDSGASWSGGVVTRLRGTYGSEVFPGGRMGTDGACYLATTQGSNPIGAPTNVKGVLWRLAPGANTISSVFTMTDRVLRLMFLAPGGSGQSERLIALTRISGPGDGEAISCGQGCETYRDGGFYRLIWEPLPPV